MSDSAFIVDFSEKCGILKRYMRTEKFNFILIKTNALIPVRKQVKNALSTEFPERTSVSIAAKNKTGLNIAEQIYMLARGIVYIDDFENLILNNTTAREFNNRTRKLAFFDVTIIGFILSDVSDLVQKQLPDLWKVHTLSIDLDYVYTYNLIKSKVDEDAGKRFISEDEKKLKLELTKVIKQKLTTIIDDNKNIPLIYNFLLRLTTLFADLSKYDEALWYCKELLSLLLSIENKNKTIIAEVYKQIGKYNYELYRFEEAEINLGKALELAEECNLSSQIPEISKELGTAFNREGDHENAIKLFKKAIRKTEESFGRNHSQVAVLQSNLASIYQETNNPDACLALLEKALASAKINYPNNHPKIAIRESNLAIIYLELGDYKRACELFNKALNISIRIYGEKHPATAVLQSNLAQAYRGLGNFKKARILLENAVKVQHSQEIQNPAIAIVYNNLAWVYRDMKIWRKAKISYEKANEILSKEYGESHPNTITVKTDLEIVNKHINGKSLFSQHCEGIFQGIGNWIKLNIRSVKKKIIRIA